MGNAIISAEVFGILALINVLYGVCFEQKQKNDKTKAFVTLIILTILCLAVDALSYFKIDLENLEKLQFMIVLSTFVLPFLMVIAFLHYLYLHILTNAMTNRRIFFVAIIFSILGIPFSLYYSFKGLLFVIEGGAHTVGEYYEGYLLLYAIILVYTQAIILANAKKIGLHDTIASSMFIFIPLVFIAINYFWKEFEFEIASSALSVLIINTMLQSERVNNVSILARSDKLTTLQNRLAFTETIKKLRYDENKMGVIFADVNGLKYTNDTYGHKEGDKLLCDFGNILISNFRKEDIFRISGDEFVVLLYHMPEPLLEEKFKKLYEHIQNQKYPIAAIGKSYGYCKDVNSLVEMAESDMYRDKKIFHENFPQYSRK